MDSRKYQLKKQIIEALKANDNDLYSLLKSQWAHRFGVDSLEELKDLDLNKVNKNPEKEDHQNIYKSKEENLEADIEISLKDNDNEEKELTNIAKKVVASIELDKKESYDIKSYKTVDKENYENKGTNQVREYKNHSKVEALIPLPPKPKYSYLRKWLLTS